MNATTQQASRHDPRHYHTDVEPGENSRNNYITVNGRAQTNQGFRQVAFSPTGEIRQVFKAERSGAQHKRHTRQSAKNGDFILRFEWYPEVWRIYEIRNGFPYDLGANGFLDKDIQAVIRSLPRGLDAWLEEAQQGPSYLPAGCGWDGENTTSDMRKRDSIARFFGGVDQAYLDDLIRSAMISPANGLPMKWAEGKVGVPEKLTGYAKQVTVYSPDSDDDITYNRWCDWVLWFDDGRVDVHKVIATEGDIIIHGMPHVVEYDQPMQLPRRVKRAVRITRNAYDGDNDRMWGVTWELYVRPRHLHRH